MIDDPSSVDGHSYELKFPVMTREEYSDFVRETAMGFKIEREATMRIARYPTLLLWMQAEQWSMVEASLLAFSINPHIMPDPWMECYKDMSVFRGRYGIPDKEDFYQLHCAIANIIASEKLRGTVRDPMPPIEWMEFFIKSGIELPVELFKAFKLTYPDSPWSAGTIRDGRILDYVEVGPAPCPWCSEKNQKILELQEKIKALEAKKASANQNKALQVVAGLIRANYKERGSNEVKTITQNILNDLQSVGCEITHETLKKYFDEGNELLKT